jgi:ornithine cyclodeaminase/alanine dehydrogenase-like protein (mu-crystallin family)
LTRWWPWPDRPPATGPLHAKPVASGKLWSDWEQASHNGDLVHAVEAGLVGRSGVTQLGDVLARTAKGRRSPDEITVFDSTGLAIQDLAIALRRDRARRRAQPSDARPLITNAVGSRRT